VVKEANSILTDVPNFLKEKFAGLHGPSLVVLDSFPLTPNGKLDSRALPAPDVIQTSERCLDELPQDPIEQLLASVWRDLLRIQHISAYDNFFDLGGHSLLATQMVSRLEKETGFAHEAERAGFSNSRAVCSKLQRKIKTSMSSVQKVLPFYFRLANKPIFGCYMGRTQAGRDRAAS